jgi:hypothetical protein
MAKLSDDDFATMRRKYAARAMAAMDALAIDEPAGPGCACGLPSDSLGPEAGYCPGCGAALTPAAAA